MPKPTPWTKLAAWMAGHGAQSRLPLRMFWTGFVIRVLYLTLAHTFRVRLILDHFEFGWEMGRIARALATGYGFADPFTGHSGPTAWTPPLYPLLMAGVFKLFGVYTAMSAWVILFLNCIASAATAPLVYEIALRCFGRAPLKNSSPIIPNGFKIALWSGWLWALYPAAMQYAVRWIWDMALTAFFFSWVIVLALRLRGIGEPDPASSGNSQTTRRWAAFGLVWGLIALTNSTPLVFLPACGLWILAGAWKTPAFLPAFAKAVLSGLVFCACLAPWLIRNYEVFHLIIPIRGNLGAELYDSTVYNGFPWGTTIPVSDQAPEFLDYKRMGEAAYVKQQDLRARQSIAQHKTRFVQLAVKRFYFYWVSVPHPVEPGFKAFLVETVRVMDFCLLSITGLLGLALALRNRIPGAPLFLWAFLLMPLTYYFITVQARFRHPLEPLICILTVYLFQSADRTRTWSWQKPTQNDGVPHP